MKLKNIAGFIAPQLKEPSVCESCGEEFICGASIKGCWCMKADLSDATRQQLKKEFKDCLCPECLEKLEEK
ncbi:MAG: cysteine-rich CWC family protein [Acidobacteria bacterium]|nr:cysteine-rich CWC family protein [Acidobacteriota bacterium]